MLIREKRGKIPGKAVLDALCAAGIWCLIASAGVASGAASRQYDDPRIVAWSAGYLAGDRESVLRQVETDLVSPEPHMFSPHIWVLLQDHRGRLADAWSSIKDPFLKKALGQLPDIYLLSKKGEYKKMFRMAPPATARQIHDPWVLHYLFFAAYDSEQYQALFEYGRAIIEQWPDAYQSLWVAINLTEEDRRRSAAIEEVLRKAGGGKDSLIARAYAASQQRGNFETEHLVSGVRLWLTERPDDARAYLSLGRHLDEQDSLTISVQAYERSLSLYPFWIYWEDHAAKLLKLGRDEEARKFLAQSSQLEATDEINAALLEQQRLSAALRQAGRQREAREVIEAASAKWPDDPGVLRERIAVELASDRPKDALPFAEKLAEIEPADLGDKVKLIEILAKSGDLDQAQRLFERVEREQLQKSLDLYKAGAAILKQRNRSTELAALWDRAEKEFSGSVTVLRNRADSHAAGGRSRDAVAAYRKSFEIVTPGSSALKRYAEQISRADGAARAGVELDQVLEHYPWLKKLPEGSGAQVALKPAPDAEPAARSTAPRLISQIGHAAQINAVALSRDGSKALTASDDHTAVLWDVAGGREVRRFSAAAAVNAAAFAPDGRSILTGDSGGSGKLWNASTGELMRSVELDAGAHVPAAVLAVAFSPDGTRALIAGRSSSMLLWDIDTGEIIRTLCCSSASVSAAAFSPDGSIVVAGGGNALLLWDPSTGRMLGSLSGHEREVTSVAVSRDGRYFASGDKAGVLRIWHAASGIELRRIETGGDAVRGTAFTPDGALVLAGLADGSAAFWELETGARKRQIGGNGALITSAVLSENGKLMLTGGMDRTAWLWDASSGAEVQRLEGRSVGLPVVSFSPDGRFLATAGQDKAPHIWDLTQGREHARLAGHADAVSTVLFSKDSRTLITGSKDRSARLWQLGAAKSREGVFADHSGEVKRVLFSPDGRYAVTVDNTRTARLCSVTDSKAPCRRFRGLADEENAVAFSPDSTRLIFGEENARARVWDLAAGAEVLRLEGHDGEVSSVAFSPDGTIILTGGHDHTIRVWDAATGASRGMFPVQAGAIVALGFSPDGKLLASVSPRTGITLWDPVRRKKLGRLGEETLTTSSIAVSPGGAYLLSGGQDGVLHLWHVENGREIASFPGQMDNAVRTGAFSPDERLLAVGGADRTTRFIETRSGKELCRLYSFRDGTWAVLDNEGRYDASQGGAVEGLHWAVGNELIALSQLKERYYEPGLLAKIAGFNKEPIRRVDQLSGVKLFPKVSIIPPAPGSTRAVIHLKNQGGGIGRVMVKVNGKEILADARGDRPGADDQKAEMTVDLAGAAVEQGGENTIEVIVWNKEGYLSNGSAVAPWRTPAAAREQPPEAYLIIAGVSHYANSGIDLRFSGKDAADFASAAGTAAKRFFGANRVHVSLLSDHDEAAGALAPDRNNLEQAFRAARAARPGDVLVVYLAGHGVMTSGEGADYYYLTKDARSLDLTDPEVRKRAGISSAELTEWTKHIPALKQVMILDTCAAGGAASKLTEQRSLPSEQIRSLERLKDRTGFHVLMGAAADAASLEANKYGQGLLTYSLLEGMKGAALRSGRFIDVQELFRHAESRVPELARSVGGIQKPLVAAPLGASFDIGMLTDKDKEHVRLTPVKPMVLRSNFQAVSPPVDTLRLTRAVNMLLSEISFKTRGGGILVYLDTDEFPEAYLLSGNYRIAGDTVSTSIYLMEGERHQEFSVEGAKDDIPGLAARIVDEMVQRISSTGPR